MLTLNLAPIFKARNIEKPYSFLVKAGLSPHVATDIVTNNKSMFSLTHIDILCSVLFCTPNDLFVWSDSKENPIPDNHPLREIIGFAPDADALMAELHTLSPAALSRLAKKLKEDQQVK